MDKRAQEFCHKYEAYIQPSHRNYRRISRMKPIWYDEDSPIKYQQIVYDEIPMAEITIPIDRLNALLDLEDLRTRLEMEVRPINQMALTLLTEYENECRIRHGNPAVKKAYDQYKMLLELAR